MKKHLTSEDGLRLVRVSVLERGKSGIAKLQVSKSIARHLKAGELIEITLPLDATAEQLKEALPEICTLEDGEDDLPDDSEDTRTLETTWRNLKSIGVALRNHQEQFGALPPAFLLGPDGKPWHSWRVMVLPSFLNEEYFKTYTRYRWDEPWDGPNNRRLLSRMPAEYADPSFGKNKEFYTHYAAVVGDGAAFSAKGAKLGPDGERGFHLGRPSEEFTDGPQNTLIVGEVSPDQKIPWMKPEDIHISGDFPAFGKPNGFALPYKTSRGPASPFLRGDTSTVAILESAQGETLKALVTIAGNENVDWSSAPHFRGLPPAAVQMGLTPEEGEKLMQVIYITRTGNGLNARRKWELPQKQ